MLSSRKRLSDIVHRLACPVAPRTAGVPEPSNPPTGAAGGPIPARADRFRLHARNGMGAACRAPVGQGRNESSPWRITRIALISWPEETSPVLG